MPRWATGDRVTVLQFEEDDPEEIRRHRHAIVAQVMRGTKGVAYLLGHAKSPNRFGPYPEEHLADGWVHTR